MKKMHKKCISYVIIHLLGSFNVLIRTSMYSHHQINISIPHSMKECDVVCCLFRLNLKRNRKSFYSKSIFSICLKFNSVILETSKFIDKKSQSLKSLIYPIFVLATAYLAAIDSYDSIIYIICFLTDQKLYKIGYFFGITISLYHDFLHFFL